MRRSEAEAEFMGGFDAAARQDAEEFKRLDARIAELDTWVRDVMAAHGPGTLASDTLYERGVALLQNSKP